MTEKNKYEEIWDKTCGYLTMDNDQLSHLVALALLKVPKKIANRVLKECLFLMPSPGMMGFRVPKRLLQGRDAIVLSEKLLEEDEKDIVLTILHEVGHFYLNHKTVADKLSAEEWRKQEEDADRWARQWIEDTTA